MHFHTDTTAHTTAFDGPIMDHRLERKIAHTANASAMQDRCALSQVNIHPDMTLEVART